MINLLKNEKKLINETLKEYLIRVRKLLKREEVQRKN